MKWAPQQQIQNKKRGRPNNRTQIVISIANIRTNTESGPKGRNATPQSNIGKIREKVNIKWMIYKESYEC
jgi:hypothetical protein